MKIEIYYHELIDIVEKHINKQCKAEFSFEDFEGDIHTQVKIVKHHYDEPGRPITIGSHHFCEGDSISFYLD